MKITLPVNSGKIYSEQDDDLLRKSRPQISHAELAVMLGRDTASIRNRCYRLGIVNTFDNWTEQQIAELRKVYESAKCNKEIGLADLSHKFGKLKSNVSRKARELGLTNNKRAGLLASDRKLSLPKYSSDADRKKAMKEKQLEWLKTNLHPRGMLGKKHSEATKERLSITCAESNAKRTDAQKVQYNIKAAMTKIKNGTYAPKRTNASWKAGWREVGGKSKYYRSRWEANYARYLQFLKDRNEIEDWMHEPKTFWFKDVKRGTVSYLPDFWVLEKNGTDSFHEVKGWMDNKSSTKIRRMAKYYPDVKLILIQEKQYKEIEKKLSSLLPGWE